MREIRNWNLILARKPVGKITGRFLKNWNDVIKVALDKAGK
jgi:hypothetical protein